jgi:hypothetical protein
MFGTKVWRGFQRSRAGAVLALRPTGRESELVPSTELPPPLRVSLRLSAPREGGREPPVIPVKPRVPAVRRGRLVSVLQTASEPYQSGHFSVLIARHPFQAHCTLLSVACPSMPAVASHALENGSVLKLWSRTRLCFSKLPPLAVPLLPSDTPKITA